jgi:hypothetical protein
MQASWNGDANCIYVGEQIPVVFKEANPVFACYIYSPLYIYVCNTHELDIFQQAQNSRVVLAHIANPNDPNAKGLGLTSLTENVCVSQ